MAQGPAQAGPCRKHRQLGLPRRGRRLLQLPQLLQLTAQLGVVMQDRLKALLEPALEDPGDVLQQLMESSQLGSGFPELLLQLGDGGLSLIHI